MFEEGLLDEVQNLLDAGYAPELPSMSALGYRQCVAVLNGEMSQDEAITQMKRITRVFVRRQANWFKDDDRRITWFDAGGAGLFIQIEQEILKWLSKI
jgi:tRNA dimethylallyltransferase